MDKALMAHDFSLALSITTFQNVRYTYFEVYGRYTCLFLQTPKREKYKWKVIQSLLIRSHCYISFFYLSSVHCCFLKNLKQKDSILYIQVRTAFSLYRFLYTYIFIIYKYDIIKCYKYMLIIYICVYICIYTHTYIFIHQLIGGYEF